MEPVGLAVGVLGLAGLFSSCLEAVEKLQSYKAFGTDSQHLNTQFKADKFRFERWGRQVGFAHGKLAASHHQALDNSGTASTVAELFLIIKRVCDASDDAPQHLVRRGPGPGRDESSSVNQERAEQTKLFGTVVQQLHSLIPPDGANGASSVHGPNTVGSGSLGPLQEHFSDQGNGLAKLRQMIARLEGEIQAATRREVHSWLLGRHFPDELYYDSIQKKLDGTCDWILGRPAFLSWLSPDFAGATAKLLWINGPPGYGKTILCARLVEYLSSTLRTPVAHFFFSTNFESREDPFVAIRSWVSQIASHHTGAFDLVHQEREAEQHQVATRATIIKLFRELLRAIPGCTLIVDGLDECTSPETSVSVARFLETIRQAVADTTTRVMIVSRDEFEIRHSLVNNMAEGFAEYKIAPDDVRADTASYSRSIVHRTLPNKTEDFKTDISEKMTSRCEGQFLWLKMQEECLRRGLNRKQLQQAISETPKGLDRLYERNWEIIATFRERERVRAFSLLRWAALALRPLTVCEITEAVLIDEDSDDLPIDELPDSIDQDYIDSEVLSLCGPFLEVRGDTLDRSPGLRTVHMTHFSVKQFLLQNMPTRGEVMLANESLRVSKEASEHSFLATLCLRYISFQRVWQRNSQEHADALTLSFRDYAASSWHDHAKSGIANHKEIIRLVTDFFDESNPNWNAWREWFDSVDAELGREGTAETTPPNSLYYASRLDLTDAAIALARRYQYITNSSSSPGRTALGAACTKGNMAIVEALLDIGAETTVVDREGRTPLNSASRNGHIEVVKLLLEKGADFTLADAEGWTPLHAASSRGHIEVVKLLLEKGADFTIADDEGWTLLHAASGNGHIEVVKLLLDKGADFTSTNKGGVTPLYAASLNGHTEVVKLLLNKGADFTVATKGGRIPLNVASDKGRIEVVKLPLDKGANPAVQRSGPDDYASTRSSKSSHALWTDRAGSTNPSSLSDESIGNLEQSTEGRSQMTFFSHRRLKLEDELRDPENAESIKSVDDDIDSTVESNSGTADYLQAAVDYIVKMFTDDAELLALYQQATKGIDEAKFVRNHRRLLKMFFLNLHSQAKCTPSQEIAIRFFRSRIRRVRISSAILNVVSPSDNSVREKVNIKAKQDNLFLLNRFLNGVDSSLEPAYDETDTKPSVLGIADAADVSSDTSDDDDDDDRSGDEADAQGETALSKLEATGEFLTAGRPFSLYKQHLREFIHAAPKVVGIPERLQYNVQALQQLHSISIDERGVENSISQGICGRLWNCSRTLQLAAGGGALWLINLAYESTLRTARQLLRQPLKRGYRRLEWTCDCGEDQYADFADSDDESLRELQIMLHSQDNQHVETVPLSHTHSSSETPSASQSTPSSQQPRPFCQVLDARTTTQHQDHTGTVRQQLGDTRDNTAEITPGQSRKRFVELCVNTGEFQRQLAEIDVTDVKNDSELFNRIREKYLEIRSFRINYFLLKPIDINFVQFSLEDRHRVGILDKPLAIPNQEEMLSEGYDYYPCPLKPPPIPANIFLHHLSHRTGHKRLIWARRMPQKLHRSILHVQNGDELVVGWGIHILEGLNKFSALVATLLMLLVSGVVSVTWAVVRDDIQGGFGIGAWMTSVQAVMLMMVLAKWNEL